RIAVMRLGVLQQIGTPQELYNAPANTFVAGFIGSPAMNLVPAELFGLGSAGRLAGFRPEHIEPGHSAADGALRFDASVEAVEFLGDEQIAHLRVGDAELVAKLPADSSLAEHGEQSFEVASDKVFLFDAESGRSLGTAAS
ncbi:MAG TPA: TOBE domain-containing protein, partial [Gaiellaceae bacterium]|nr:TOBE domain-containing protein [Gaiellaceae bacterium]